MGVGVIGDPKMGDRVIGDPIKWRQNHWGPCKRNRAIGDPEMGTEPLGIP